MSADKSNPILEGVKGGVKQNVEKGMNRNSPPPPPPPPPPPEKD